VQSLATEKRSSFIMMRWSWFLAIAAPLALAVPAGAQGCGMGMGQTGMGPGCCGMTGMAGGMCSMGDGPMPGSPLGPVMMMLNHLDLSDAQWEEVDGIMADLEEQIAAAAEEAGLADPQAAYIEMFTSPTLTVSDVESFDERMKELGQEIRDIHAEALVLIHDVLTPDQLGELSAMAAERGEGDGGRCGRGADRSGHVDRSPGRSRTGSGRGTR